MIRGQDIPDDRLYQPEHVKTVLSDLLHGLGRYMVSFGTDEVELALRFHRASEAFEKERPRYLSLLDRRSLDEYGYDPGAFKGTLRRECPIIHRCLYSPAKVMDSYREEFQRSQGSRLLEVTQNIVNFGRSYMSAFDGAEYEYAKSPADLGLGELDTEPFTAYGVIGGGIRSHFLYNLYPNAFPNRSQNAVWAFYFLTDRKDYGFRDGSEFLMIDANGAGTQQNFFYPYDLFTFYALQLYRVLGSTCRELGHQLDPSTRYVHVNAFLDHVADVHRADIDILKPPYERFDY